MRYFLICNDFDYSYGLVRFSVCLSVCLVSLSVCSSTMLISLDLSFTFDTIDHSILLNHLQTTFGITVSALAWFHSYLAGQSQFVHIGGSRSPITQCFTDVPQGFVMGLIFFHAIYIYPIAHIVSSFGLSQQQYAGDTRCMSLYPKTIMLFQLLNSSSVSLPSIYGSATIVLCSTLTNLKQ